jgi:hypothetical protein
VTAVVKRRVSPNLARLIRRPGGKSVGAIQAEVQARLQRMEAGCYAEAQQAVARMTDLAARLPASPGPDDLGPLYALGNEIVGLSGVSGLTHAGRAALSFCRLLDRAIIGLAWRRAPFDVHLAAITLLCRPDCRLGPEERDRIVEGLNGVVKGKRA